MNPKVQPIIKLGTRSLTPLNLSIGNAALNADVYDNLPAFCAFITEACGKSVGYGGYLKRRAIYTSRVFAPQVLSDNKNEPISSSPQRDTHLGIDLWSPAGETIFAPLQSRVHSFRNNSLPKDYGGTVILEHHEADRTFYTLYGHLSLASLAGLAVGQEIYAGEAFAKTGKPSDNGGWPPHLHFQVIRKLEAYAGDFPGVCFNDQLNIWKALSPDPWPYTGLNLSSQSVP